MAIVTTVALLGAGFSRAAGLPMVSELFSGELPLAKPGADLERMTAVQVAYRNWAADRPDPRPELWMKGVFERSQLNVNIPDPNWFDVVQFVLRRLSKPKNAGPGSYYYGITRPQKVHPDHDDFWRALRISSDRLSVVTLNYDILAEHALHDLVLGKPVPVFFYGGFTFNQHVQRIVSLSGSGPRSKSIALGHEVPIYKLHGSVNWAWEPHSETLKIHDDVRAAYRQEKAGVPAVVPPVAEKQLNPEFTAIWLAAERELINSERWVVCGYSAPAYDEAARSMIARAAAQGPPKRIELIDPNADNLRAAWSFDGVQEIRLHYSIQRAIPTL